MLKRLLITALAAGLLSTATLSATFTKTPVYDGTGHPIAGKYLIGISGDLLPGDDKTFEAVVTGDGYYVIAFNSPGGNLFTGLRIGGIIHDRHFETGVYRDNLCTSACALAWVAGNRRNMSRTAKIGFHAAYETVNGGWSETGQGNAVLGAYLSRLGLSFQAIKYMTAAHPNQIQFLTPDDARILGINIVLVDAGLPVEDIGFPKPAQPAPAAVSIAPINPTPRETNEPIHVLIALAGTYTRGSSVCPNMKAERAYSVDELLDPVAGEFLRSHHKAKRWLAEGAQAFDSDVLEGGLTKTCANIKEAVQWARALREGHF